MSFTHGFKFGFNIGVINSLWGGYGGFGCCWGAPMFYTPMFSSNIFMPYINSSIFPTPNYTNFEVPDFSYKSTSNNFQNFNLNIDSKPLEAPKFQYDFNKFCLALDDTPLEFEKSKSVEKDTDDKNDNNELTELKGKHWTEMTDAEMRKIYGNYTRDITEKYNGTAEQLNKYLAGKGKLEGMGEAFLKAQEEYGISASVLVAICMNESGGGTNTYAKERNNVSSLRKSGSTEFKTFDSVEECILETAKLLKNYYIGEKKLSLKKLYQINAKYCPTADPTDKDNLNSFWARNVEYYTKQVEAQV